MKNFTFLNPTKLLFGEGQVANVDREAAVFGKKVLIVTGGGSVKRSGLFDQVMDHLKSEGLAVYELAGVEPNPRLTTIHKGIEICKTEGIDLVLAVGGGSVIDASKAICAGAKYDGDVWDFYLGKAVVEKALPLGVILTLAATGSEMNGGSVVTNWETQQKLSTGSIHLYPKFSILDPTLTYTVPKDQTVYGIVDMMAHVFEQYFSHTENTPLQDRLCESVLNTVIENAEPVLKNPEDYEARSNLLLGGTMALNGMISMGMEGDWATHGIEHEVSAIYDIPHGGGLAILFPNWMKYVVDERVEKFKQFAIRVWNVDPSGKTDKEIALEGIEKVREFFNQIGAPSRLKDYDIDDRNLDLMAEKAVEREGTIGRFKKLTKEDVKNILTMSL
ncbi:iron-containing alcohol dehydrogenase [Tepidibacillus sp. HK-1]|uniref:iron-containing alcohol dehydrogenase n=1 Tax=Tepidibacillus sp. HK-1 TaxID=1883407 RepID=UPI000853680D|nr:iron-containing alcohol dehydrogenase [Tepidibacillus sp. HK-1]GBF11924.1 NADH-dependent butanol dehydrogenase A [Tepidibacillus sp. HK-1]